MHSGKAVAKAVIRGIFFRAGWYRGNYHILENLFRFFNDPWNFEHSPYEKDRMDVLISALQKYPHASVLEVGCAEGVFTSRLAGVCKKVVALDVSETAIERARRRCPGVTFIKTRIEEFETNEQFDIVVCSETLYYVKDVAGVLRKLSRLGRYCLVSYLSRESKVLDSRIADLPLLEFRTFSKLYGMIRYSMKMAVWKNQPAINEPVSP